MATNTTLDDDFVPLALSLYSNPGAYAVLAGAGVSRGAGIATAWDIVVDLINKLAEQTDSNAVPLDVDTAGPWYENRYGTEATYSRVLETLGRTQHERAAMLRTYLETDADDPTLKIEPSKAHRAVARLMEMGVIRVVVTLNFDRLFEAALHELKIEPVIVATESDAEGLAPLHTLSHCVIHLHGDYLNPRSMLNTDQELDGYGKHMEALLKTVLGDYGLIVAGWSAVNDPALREIFEASHRRYYTMGWINRSKPAPDAADLLNRYEVRELRTDADNALGRLRDIVETLTEENARHPLTATIAASRIKRYVSGQQPAISAHDTVATELAELRATPSLVQYSATGDTAKEKERYLIAAKQVAVASRVAATCCATLAYWGDDGTESWWLPEIDWFTHDVPSRGGFSYETHNSLRRTSGWLLFHAAGIAAVAAGHTHRVLRILERHRAATEQDSSAALRQVFIDSDNSHIYLGHRAMITDLVANALSLSTDRVDNAWQIFDLLHLALDLSEHPRFAVTIENKLPGGLEHTDGPDLLDLLHTMPHPFFFPHIQCVQRFSRTGKTGMSEWETPAATNIDPRYLTRTPTIIREIASDSNFSLPGLTFKAAVEAANLLTQEYARKKANNRVALNRIWLDQQIAP